MATKKISLVLISSLVIAGCSTNLMQSPKEQYASAFVNKAQASQTLAQKAICCNDFSQLQYQEINNNDDLSIPLNSDSQVFNFPSGKSFVQAYKLTSKNRELKLHLNAIIANTVVQPQVTLLDGNFNITRTISADKFIYQEAKLLEGDMLSANITIYRPLAGNLANETYLLFYTTEQAKAGGTTIVHPAKSFAKAHGTVPPSIADPIIPHSAMGLITVKIEVVGSRFDTEDSYIPETSLLQSDNAPRMSENEFNNAILDAVAANNINNALALIDQAEAAGSQTARQTFVNALSQTTVHIPTAAEKDIVKAIAENDIAKALALVEEEEANGSQTARNIFIKALKKSKK